MRPELWAIFTAVCWGVGSFFEKRGVKLGGLSPAMGSTVRTATSLLILSVASYPVWGQVPKAGPKALLMVAGGGGLLAGALGVLFLYKGLQTWEFSKVRAVAFCLTPVVGLLMAIVFLREGISLWQGIGTAMAIGGAALVCLG